MNAYNDIHENILEERTMLVDSIDVSTVRTNTVKVPIVGLITGGILLILFINRPAA